MPNHVANRVIIDGNLDDIKKIMNFVKGEKSPFDFNKIVPMPETFIKYDTTNHPNGRGLVVGEHTLCYDESSPVVTEELIEEYKRATEEQAERYGVVGWYNWSRAYWGTKWNCYDVVVLDEGAFEFNTAWSAPLPVMQALSEIFPEVIINLDWADEDAGCNTGEATYEGGSETSLVYFDNLSDEAWEQYFRLHEGDEEFYERDEDGRWRLKEDC